MSPNENELTDIPSLTLGEDEIRTHQVLNPHRDTAPETGTQAAASTHRTLWLLLLLLTCLSAAGAYTSWQAFGRLEQALAQSTGQAEKAQQPIEQLQQQLDGRIASTQASGAAIGQQLEESNREIRKLWDLANKRNRTAIEQLTAALQKQEQSSKTLAETLQKNRTRLDQIEQSLKAQTGFEEQLQTQKRQLAQIQSANDVTLALLQEQLQNLGKEQKALKTQQQQLAGKSQAFDDAVRSLDSYRQQINRQLQSLQQQLQAH